MGKNVVILSIVVLMIMSIIGTSMAADMAQLRRDIESLDWETRLAAVEELGKIRNEEAFNLLLKVADTWIEYWPVKIKAITLLGEIGNRKAIEVLLKIFYDPFLNRACPAIKSYTAQSLGSFTDDTMVVDALITGLDDYELLTQEASIRSLGKIKNPKAVPHLIGMLNNKSVALKLSAIQALGDIGDVRSVPNLQRVAESDSDPLVRNAAATALKSFK